MMKSTLFRTIRLTLLSSSLIAVISGQPAFAASACKGLEQTTCEAKAECRWMNGYTRKDGIKVSSYCRIGAKNKATATEPAKAVSNDPPKATTAEPTKAANTSPLKAVNAPPPKAATTEPMKALGTSAKTTP